MTNVLVVAAHPDDETLGCGGTLLRHVDEGDSVHWLIATAMTPETGHTSAEIDRRSKEIDTVAKKYKFASVNQLGFDTAGLDVQSRKRIIENLLGQVEKIKPHSLYLPFPGDVHSDHQVVFECAMAAVKKFRTPYIGKIMTCEILSETEFGMDPSHLPFRPNLFVDISDFLEEKIRIMNTYEGETGNFPFPRSEQAIRSLAAFRGVQCASTYAEAFMIVSEHR